MDDLDFEPLEERLVEPGRLIQLLPGEIINDGYAIRLVPARDGKPIEVGESGILPETLPTLDMKVAGIETDRREATIRSEVEKFLDGRTFFVVPAFDIVSGIALLPTVIEYIDVAGLALKTAFLPSDGEIEKIKSSIYAFKMPFWVGVTGDAIPGLDLARTVEGYLPTVVSFLTAKTDLKGNPALSTALQAAIRYKEARRIFDATDARLESALVTGKKKLLYRLFKGDEQIGKIRKANREKLLHYQEPAAAALAALQSN